MFLDCIELLFSLQLSYSFLGFSIVFSNIEKSQKEKNLVFLAKISQEIQREVEEALIEEKLEDIKRFWSEDELRLCFEK